jgi:hypothetical protein
MFFDGIHGKGPRRVRRAGQNIGLSSNFDDVWSMAASRAFCVKGMNRAAIDRRNRVLDKTLFVEGIGVNRGLDIKFITDV